METLQPAQLEVGKKYMYKSLLGHSMGEGTVELYLTKTGKRKFLYTGPDGDSFTISPHERAQFVEIKLLTEGKI